jgi:hypothetical protein
MNPPFHPPSVCPSVNLSSLHLPHTETHQWGPHPSSFFPEISALPGALTSHWGTRFCILHIFPTFIHYLLYRCLGFPSFTFDHHHSRPAFLLATRNPCHPWLERYFSFLPLLASSISSEYYPGHLPLSSEFVHLVPPLAQLIPDLVVPLTLDLVTRLRPRLLSYTLQPRAVWSPPTFLTPSVYLCHFLTTVDSAKPLASGSRVLLLSTSAHFSKRTTVS